MKDRYGMTPWSWLALGFTALYLFVGLWVLVGWSVSAIRYTYPKSTSVQIEETHIPN